MRMIQYRDYPSNMYGEKSAKDFETPEEMEAFECGVNKGLSIIKSVIEEMMESGGDDMMGMRGDMVGRRYHERRGRDSRGRYM